MHIRKGDFVTHELKGVVEGNGWQRTENNAFNIEKGSRDLRSGSKGLQR
jgi:hypothetical protein